MLVVKPVGNRNEPFIELPIPGLITTNQQDRDPPRIKRIENPKWPSANLNP
jgi:hypothetical protein